MSPHFPVWPAPAVRPRDGVFRLMLLLLPLLGCAVLAASAAGAPVVAQPPATTTAAPSPELASLAAAPTALRLLANRLELAADGRALDARLAAVAAEPENPAHRVALVETALRFCATVAAEHALDGLDAFAAVSPSLISAQAAVDCAGNFSEKAAARLGAICPNLTDLALNVAILNLRYGSPHAVTEARSQLTVWTQSHFSVARLQRELLLDALRNQGPATALALLRADPPVDDGSLEMEIFNADLERLAQPAEPLAAFAERLGRAATRPATAALFAEWLIAQGHADDALAWLARQPAALHTAPECLAAQADACVALQRWDAAWPLLEAGAWGARVPPIARTDAWPQSIAAAHGDLAILRVLQRLALARGSAAGREAVLTALVRAHPAEGWAFQALADLYHREKATAKLAALYAQWHEAAPANVVVESNRLLLSLLTIRKSSAEQRETIDRQTTFHPEQPLFVLARAFSLWQTGRAPEAFAMTENLPVSTRFRMPQALYHGLFAAASGQRNDYTRLYLQVAAQAPLLPEEAELLKLAQKLAAAPPP